MGLLVLLPFVAFGLISVICVGEESRVQEDRVIRRNGLVLGLSIWAAFLVLITEVLSLLNWVTLPGVAIGWAVVIGASVVLGIGSGRLERGWEVIGQTGWGLSKWEVFLLGGSIIVVGTELVVGLVSPANSVDVLQYHLPRVLHWIQNHSLAHYPVVHQSQNIRPLWSEMTILNLRLLWGGDRLDHLVQWGSMISTVLLVSGTTAILGGNRKAQWLTAVFALTVPMGVLQAETAQNDYVATLWAVALAYLVVLSSTRSLTRLEIIGLGLTLGVGILTKGTLFMFALPLMVWFLFVHLRRTGWRVAIRAGITITLAVVAINAGFWTRNIVTYGGPYGSGIPIHIPGLSFSQPTTTFQVATPFISANIDNPKISMIHNLSSLVGMADTPSSSTLLLEMPREVRSNTDWVSSVLGPIGSLLAKTARMLTMNFVTPVKAVNDAIFTSLSAFPKVFTKHFIGMLKQVAWNYEMTAGNPVHLLLIFAALIVLLVLRKKDSPIAVVILGLCGFIGFGLLSTGSTSDLPYSIRYQLPFFFLASPLVGVAFGKLRFQLDRLMSAALLVYAVPYLLFSYMKPVIGMPPWPTRVESVFVTPPSELLFALSPGKQDEYSLIAKSIQSNSCARVGLFTNYDDLEYTFWWLLSAPQSGIQIRYVEAPPPTDKLIDPYYRPCAIICTRCKGKAEFHGLPLAIDAGHVRLFMVPGVP